MDDMDEIYLATEFTKLHVEMDKCFMSSQLIFNDCSVMFNSLRPSDAYMRQ